MKVLLDECLPHDLRGLLPPHDVFTVAYMGWSGVKNGELLARAAEEGFDAFLTLDTGMAQQHNPADLKLPVVTIRCRSARLADLTPLLPDVIQALASLKGSGFYRVP